jgi:Icc-related predicted phosphoesterase
VCVLQGETITLGDVSVVGVKGFAGGFGRHTLGHWGESATKRFVQEAIDEALLLETGLARLRTRRRVVLLHYSPIEATVRGEPASLFPFLGCSRLEEPLLRYPIDAVFHGHAHRGCLEGQTRTGVPVYNVALPLLRTARAEQLPFRVLDLNSQPERDSAAPSLAVP